MASVRCAAEVAGDVLVRCTATVLQGGGGPLVALGDGRAVPTCLLVLHPPLHIRLTPVPDTASPTARPRALGGGAAPRTAWQTIPDFCCVGKDFDVVMRAVASTGIVDAGFSHHKAGLCVSHSMHVCGAR